MKKLPIGIENFEEIIKKDYYYVDKTQMIADLITDGTKVTLFTRPRRFGKSLNMSMLQYFFEIGRDKSIFDGLKISRDSDLCDKHMGRYPVVSISLKGVDGLNFETAYDRLRIIIRNEARRLSFLQDSAALTSAEHDTYIRLTGDTATESDITASLQDLCTLLDKHYGQKAVLLIDEYDVPLDKAYVHGYYPQMIDLIRAMLGAALKTNSSLFFAVLTGCLRVSKESIFTGLNNLKVRSITDVKFDEYFGFTDEEVHQLLADYGLSDHYEEVRDWYDGYLFGNQNIYCPWDVINYCDDLTGDPQAEPQSYWLNTSGNDMVRNLIQKADTGTVQMEIEELISGRTISKRLNEQLTHNEVTGSIDNIWSILYMTGYLTLTKRPSGGVYTLKIPNREVRQIFMYQVLKWFEDEASKKEDKLSELYTAFETGDTETITEYLNDQLLDTVSFYDAHESFYHGFLLALLNTCANWRVSSNRETGKGRSDIIVERKDRKIGFVVEVKNVREEEELDAACEKAMNQIEEKQYVQPLRRYRVKEIRAYAIAFWDKECRVVMKQLV